MNDLQIKKIDTNIYAISNKNFYLIGYYEKMNQNMSKVNLISWYDKNTKRYKTNKNKLYNHMTKWFDYIIEKYYKEAV